MLNSFGRFEMQKFQHAYQEEDLVAFPLKTNDSIDSAMQLTAEMLIKKSFSWNGNRWSSNSANILRLIVLTVRKIDIIESFVCLFFVLFCFQPERKEKEKEKQNPLQQTSVQRTKKERKRQHRKRWITFLSTNPAGEEGGRIHNQRKKKTKTKEKNLVKKHWNQIEGMNHLEQVHLEEK